MDELNLSVCVLDAGSMAEENLDHFELVSRIRAAVLRLQQDGLKVIVVDPKDEHWERLRQRDDWPAQPAIDFSRCTFISAYNEPTIVDALEAVEFNDFSFYATSFDVESLIADWRLPHSTQDWLQRYRKRLEVIFHFDQGTFHLTWPSERTWPAPAVPGADPVKNGKAEGKATSYINEDGGKSYYPRAKKGPTQPDSEGPLLAPGPLCIVNLPTGWYSDSQDPNMVHQMAVFPHKVHGGLQPVLAILSHSEKETLLQSAALMCSSLGNGTFQEEEDLQQWMEGVPGPWSDQGWTSHVLIAVGGELDGLWVVGAGARKQARRRAAKLAMVVAEKASRNSTDLDWPELQRLVERAIDLMEHARAKHAREVEFPTPLTWLMKEAEPIPSIEVPEPPMPPAAMDASFLPVDV